jgi:5'-3' exonuclease
MKIEIHELLDSLKFTYEQFLDFCIMCGTDYNVNLPKIGPERAFRYISEHKSIDALELHNIYLLKHIRVRELFRNEIDFRIPNVFCGIPDINALKLFCFTNNCHFDIDKLIYNFIDNTNLTIVDSDTDKYDMLTCNSNIQYDKKEDNNVPKSL